jgi:hypothetical protein
VVCVLFDVECDVLSGVLRSLAGHARAVQLEAADVDAEDQKNGTCVSELRPITRAMQLAKDPGCTPEEVYAKLAHCTKYKVPWTTFYPALWIPPVPQSEAVGIPTCPMDTHIMEYLFVLELTGIKIMALPNCMSFDQHSLNSSSNTEDGVSLYATWSEVTLQSVLVRDLLFVKSCSTCQCLSLSLHR